MANKPDFTVKVGSINLAVWTNTGGSGSKTFEIQSISITRTYKKGDKFDTTNSLRFQDLPLVKIAIDEAMRVKYLKDVSYSQDKPTEQNNEF